MPLKANALFYLKEAIGQADGSIVVSCVCPDPGESMEALYQVTLSPSEVKGLPAIDAQPGALARLVGSKTFIEAVTALVQAKLTALAQTLRPPVDIAQAITDSIHAFDPVVELIAPQDAVEAKPAVTRGPIGGGIEEEPAVEAKAAVPGLYSGGNFIGPPLVIP